MSKWPIYFAMIFFASCDCAQHIEGTVIDEVTRMPVVGVAVVNREKSSCSTRTDMTGHFELDAVSGGFKCPPMHIIITKSGYEEMKARIPAAGSKTILLKPVKEQVCVPDPDVLDTQKVWRMPFEGKQAEFPGGQIACYKYLSKLRYPAEQIEWQGSIYVTFVVDKTGNIRNECISKRYFEGELSPVEKEALHLVAEMPRWTPAKINGKKVYSRVFLPIKF